MKPLLTYLSVELVVFHQLLSIRNDLRATLALAEDAGRQTDALSRALAAVREAVGYEVDDVALPLGPDLAKTVADGFRKQGWTLKEWCSENETSPTLVSEILNGRRPFDVAYQKLLQKIMDASGVRASEWGHDAG